MAPRHAGRSGYFMKNTLPKLLNATIKLSNHEKDGGANYVIHMYHCSSRTKKVEECDDKTRNTEKEEVEKESETVQVSDVGHLLDKLTISEVKQPGELLARSPERPKPYSVPTSRRSRTLAESPPYEHPPQDEHPEAPNRTDQHAPLPSFGKILCHSSTVSEIGTDNTLQLPAQTVAQQPSTSSSTADLLSDLCEPNISLEQHPSCSVFPDPNEIDSIMKDIEEFCKQSMQLSEAPSTSAVPPSTTTVGSPKLLSPMPSAAQSTSHISSAAATFPSADFGIGGTSQQPPMVPHDPGSLQLQIQPASEPQRTREPKPQTSGTREKRSGGLLGPAMLRLRAKLSADNLDTALVAVHGENDETLANGDQDGDTPLMILIANEWECKLEKIFVMLRRLQTIPGALEAQNRTGESALDLAERYMAHEPLVAHCIMEAITRQCNLTQER